MFPNKITVDWFVSLDLVLFIFSIFYSSNNLGIFHFYRKCCSIKILGIAVLHVHQLNIITFLDKNFSVKYNFLK